jgi:protein-S-isoprenylcysteine O-methyltransferase Ste14
MTLSFWLIILAGLAYGLLHSLLASLQAKAQARHWFGSSIERWFRLIYNLIAVLTLLPILLLPVLLIDKEIYTIRFPWIIFTGSFQALAVLALLIGLRQTGISSFIGLHQLFLPEDTSPPRLTTDGLYRFVRHPLYTAGLVFIWLLPIMTWNLLALNIGLTLYIVIGAYFEERKLLREFGDPYAEYRRRTPMLVPGLRFSHNRSHDISHHP